MPTFRDHVTAVGEYGSMLWEVVRDITRRGIEFKELVRQVVWIGSNSVPIVLLTSIFTGMVLALQTAHGLQRFGAKTFVGNIVALAVLRELGPVLTAIMLCGRVGAGITAEIASMVATEQVDAIRTLGANPIRKLVTPRVIAGTLVTPLLVILGNVIGIYGGLVVAVFELKISAHLYLNSMLHIILIRDVVDGLLKSFVFGFLLVSIACFKGLHTRGGTEGVGLSTTSAVVTGCMVILISNFFLTKLIILF